MTICDDMTRQYASRVNREPYVVILANCQLLFVVIIFW